MRGDEGDDTTGELAEQLNGNAQRMRGIENAVCVLAKVLADRNPYDEDRIIRGFAALEKDARAQNGHAEEIAVLHRLRAWMERERDRRLETVQEKPYPTPKPQRS